MEKNDKPRLAEVLGVEKGQHFEVDGYSGEYWITEDGWYDYEGPDVSYDAIISAINHPESIIRAPRLTEAEREIMRAIGAKWVSRSDSSATGDCKYVKLWKEKPTKNISGKWEETTCLDVHLAVIDAKKFPSVRFGDCICVEEADGE